MTVCIAAICRYKGLPLVIGASDRMLTVGDIEFEPPQTKNSPLTSNAVAMVSGNSATMLSVCRAAWAELQANPQTELDGIAQVVAAKFSEFRRREAEAMFLAPLGLDLPTFLLRRTGLHREIVMQLFGQFREHQLKSSLIVAGTDQSGAHIYVIRDPGRAVSNDIVGFAAIGYGRWHAESQFMFAQYVSGWPFEKALRLIYLAKKRAEVAPGVGSETDLLYVGPQPQPVTWVQKGMIDKLQEIYREHVQYMERIEIVSDSNVASYIEELEAQAEKAASHELAQKATPEPGAVTSNPSGDEKPLAEEKKAQS